MGSVDLLAEEISQKGFMLIELGEHFLIKNGKTIRLGWKAKVALPGLEAWGYAIGVSAQLALARAFELSQEKARARAEARAFGPSVGSLESSLGLF